MCGRAITSSSSNGAAALTLLPGQMLCARVGAELRVIPSDPTVRSDWRCCLICLMRKLACWRFTHVSNVLGTENPAGENDKRFTSMARVLVDGAQAVMSHPVDVQALDCDFYVFSGHDCCWPRRNWHFNVKEEPCCRSAVEEGGGKMIATVSLSEGTTWTKAPWRFEAGTPDPGGVTGLGAALRVCFGAGA
ncbi:aminotransferase class V-fold PLP-dependent enzyme [Shigella flexneri]